jgi:hypothetical protein
MEQIIAVFVCLLISMIAILVLCERQWPGTLDAIAYGSVKPMIICPHCATKGTVRTKLQRRKRGISGGKAIGGLMTGGLSLLATGLSRKEWVTQAYCGACHSRWDF